MSNKKFFGFSILLLLLCFGIFYFKTATSSDNPISKDIPNSWISVHDNDKNFSLSPVKYTRNSILHIFEYDFDYYITKNKFDKHIFLSDFSSFCYANRDNSKLILEFYNKNNELIATEEFKPTLSNDLCTFSFFPGYYSNNVHRIKGHLTLATTIDSNDHKAVEITNSFSSLSPKKSFNITIPIINITPIKFVDDFDKSFIYYNYDQVLLKY